jgi:exosome complex RNA-binding protein Rrp42 (RNase PH superfamily)
MTKRHRGEGRIWVRKYIIKLAKAKARIDQRSLKSTIEMAIQAAIADGDKP